MYALHLRIFILAILCSLPISPIFAAQSFTPGNYVFSAADSFKAGNVYSFLDAKVTVNSQTINVFRGVQRTYYWKDFELSNGSVSGGYKWTKIDSEIDELKSKYPGRKLVIQFSYKCWTYSGGDWTFPDYIKNNGAGIYGDPALGGTGDGFWVSTQMKGNLHPYIWNTKVQERMSSCLQALHDHLKATNRLGVVEAINMCESAKAGASASDPVWGAAIIKNVENMKRAFPEIWVFSYSNFPVSQLQKYADAFRKQNIGWGGPDVVQNLSKENGLKGSNNSPGTYAFYCNFWNFANVTGHAIGNRCIKGAAVQNEDYDWTNGFAYNYSLATDRLKLNYLFWQEQSPTRNTQIINFVKNKVSYYAGLGQGVAGGLNQTRPDDESPGNITLTKVTTAQKNISFTWNNPNDSDFDGIQVCRSTTGYPAQGSNVVTTLPKTTTSWTNWSLTTGTTYYYAFYTYDKQAPPNYSSGTKVSRKAGQTAVEQEWKTYR